MQSRRSRLLSGRATLLWGGLIFLGAQLTLNALLDRGLSELRDPEHEHKVSHLLARQKAQPGRPLVLLLGSSRTLFGIRPGLLPLTPSGQSPLVFNFGIPGQGSPLLELVCLRRLLAQGIHPAWVFVEILPGCLPPPVNSQDPTLPPRLACRELPVLRPYCGNSWPLYRRWGLNRLAPFYSYRFSLLNQLAPEWLPARIRQGFLWRNIDDLGWLHAVEVFTQVQRQVMLQAAHKEYADILRHFSVHPGADQAFRELLALCRAKGIQVGFYLMPEGPIYQSWYSPAARATLDHYLAGLCRNYQVPLIDARAWAAEDDFYDSHHLTPRGAAAFSPRFGRELLRRLEATPPPSAPRPSGQADRDGRGHPAVPRSS